MKALTTNKYAHEVEKDQQMSQQIGVRGVPFFVFNRKYAVSGAQPIEVFQETLDKAFKE
jgi:protein disulfide-isomerase